MGGKRRRNVFARFHKARAQRIGLVGDALPAVLKVAGVQRTDRLLPGARGEPYKDPTHHMTHFWFARRGVPGEFHLQVLLEHVPPFKPHCGVAAP